MSRSHMSLFIDFFREKINKVFPDSKSVYYNDAIVMLLEEVDLTAESPQRNKLVEFLIDNGFYAGTSYSFSDLLMIRTYYQQSVDALRFGKEQDPWFRVLSYAIHLSGK